MDLEIGVSILIGIGLAAATGFRVFVPLLVTCLAARADILPLNETFGWLDSDAALVALGAATGLEAAAYLIPGLGHLLDVVATPAAVMAGAVVTASVTGDLPPFMVWSLAAIGGGTAGVVQVGSVVARGASTLTTGGLANPLVGLGELAGSVVVSLVSILVPLGAAVVLAALLVIVVRRRRRRRYAV
jgi:Domain of unknown function (DUF4126)